MNIYLLCRDYYKDSMNLENYATNKEELFALLRIELRDIGQELLEDSFVVDFQKHSISYKYYDGITYSDDKLEDIDDIDTGEYGFMCLSKIKIN